MARVGRTKLQRSFDPPDRGATTRLSDSQLQSLQSGYGYSRRRPYGYSGDNAADAPFSARGLKSPGTYYAMARRNPVINTALYKLELTVGSRSFDFVGADDETDEEAFQREFCEQSFADLSGGMARLLRSIVGGTHQDGFALFEKVWEIEEATGLWRLEDLAWIPPWSVREWILDDSGYMLGVELVDTWGESVIVPAPKVAHFARRFRGRGDYEGESALRPLVYYDEHKRALLVNQMITAETAGEGIPAVQQTDGNVQFEPDYVLDQLDDYREAKTSGIAIPIGHDLKLWHGQTPPNDTVTALAYIDRQSRAQLDDQLSEMGVSQYGGLAIGEVQKRSSEEAQKGLLIGIVEELDEQIVVDIYERNGWDVGRRCCVKVAGFDVATEVRVGDLTTAAQFIREAQEYTDPALAAEVTGLAMDIIRRAWGASG